MLSAKDVALLYETLLANDWMGETVKVDLRLTRKTVLALSKVIEIGLLQENIGRDSLLQASIKDTMETLQNIPLEIRKKGNLTDMYDKMYALINKL